MKDIQQVLAEKLKELRLLQQQVACLKVVIPLLAEDGDKPVETEAALEEKPA